MPLDQVLDRARGVTQHVCYLQDKVVLVFEEPFWENDVDFIVKESDDNSFAFALFMNYFKLTGAPVLVALNCADTGLDCF